MLGLLRRAEGKRPPDRMETVLGVRFYVVSVPRRARGLGRRLAERAAARALCRQGILRCVPPEGEALPPAFLRRGILPGETLPLLQTLAADWTAAELRAAGRLPGTAAVAGDRLTAQMEQTVRALSERVRYVWLAVPGEGEALAAALRRENGVSLRRLAAAETAGADALLLFSPPAREPENRVVLRLYPGAEQTPPRLRLPPALEARLPQGAARLPLLCALWRGGGLKTEQIETESSKNFS